MNPEQQTSEQMPAALGPYGPMDVILEPWRPEEDDGLWTWAGLPAANGRVAVRWWDGTIYWVAQEQPARA